MGLKIPAWQPVAWSKQYFYLHSPPSLPSSFWALSQQKAPPASDSAKSVLSSVSSLVGFPLCHILPFLRVSWGTPTCRTNSRKHGTRRKLKKFVRFQALHQGITVLSLHCALSHVMENRTVSGSAVLAGIIYPRTECTIGNHFLFGVNILLKL